MKQKTIIKLLELGKKDVDVATLVETYMMAELIVPSNNISDKDKNNMLIKILKREKSNSIIQEAIRLLENDSREDNTKNNNTKEDKNYIKLSLSININGKISKLDKVIDIKQYESMIHPEFLIDDICNQFKRDITKTINNEIKGK